MLQASGGAEQADSNQRGAHSSSRRERDKASLGKKRGRAAFSSLFRAATQAWPARAAPAPLRHHAPRVRTLTIVALLLALPSFADEAEKKVARLWRAKCASCHGPDGKGQTETGRRDRVPDFSTAAWQRRTTDADVKQRVLSGFSDVRDGVGREMPSFKDELDAAQLDALVALVRRLGPSATP
jgi:cytochrome c6